MSIRDDALYRVALEEVSLPERVKERLHRSFDSPRAAFHAPPRRLLDLGLDEAHVRNLRELPLKELAERLDELRSGGVHCLWPEHDGYPRLLKEIHDPPRLLMVSGRLDPSAEGVALVGARRCTPYGRQTAAWIGRDATRLGLTVVSGAARGIDAAGLEAALEADGSPVAVLGCGIDVVYPPEHDGLLDAIAERGAVVTELPPGEPPRKRNFPRRNRIISGLCRAVVVVEGKRRSGSLITARCALDQGRSVLAVPHDLGRDGGSWEGPDLLIARGEARLLLRPEDVAEEFPMDVQRRLWPEPEDDASAPEPLPEELRCVWEHLTVREPLHVDEIAERTGLEASEAMRRLALLELEGRIERQPGLRYVRREVR